MNMKNSARRFLNIPLIYLKLLIALTIHVGVVGAEPVWVGFGSEYFNWREYDGSGTRLLEESGPRYFLGLESENAVSPEWVYGLRGRLYLGRVGYDGQTLATPPVAVATDTDYSGWSAELDFTRRFLAEASDTSGDHWGVRLALGFDSWRRNIRDTATAYGYEERYGIGYGRLGAVYTSARGWSVQGGVKLPLVTGETVGWSRFGYDDPILRPKPDYSLYATASYRFDQHWSVGGYYDSYRFKQSDTEPLTVNGIPSGWSVYQPKSQQDTIGLYLQYRF